MAVIKIMRLHSGVGAVDKVLISETMLHKWSRDRFPIAAKFFSERNFLAEMAIRFLTTLLCAIEVCTELANTDAVQNSLYVAGSVQNHLDRAGSLQFQARDI